MTIDDYINEAKAEESAEKKRPRRTLEPEMIIPNGPTETVKMATWRYENLIHEEIINSLILRLIKSCAVIETEEIDGEETETVTILPNALMQGLATILPDFVLTLKG